MKAIQSQFLDLLGANLIQFIIPVYQRIYSWDSKQCKDLWEDTMRAGRKNELEDPQGFARDKRDVQNFGPGMPTRVDLRGAADLDAVTAPGGMRGRRPLRCGQQRCRERAVAPMAGGVSRTLYNVASAASVFRESGR